jgi:hypothetical protein
MPLRVPHPAGLPLYRPTWLSPSFQESFSDLEHRERAGAPPQLIDWAAA